MGYDEDRLKELERAYDFWAKVYRDAPYEWGHNPERMQIDMENAVREMEKIEYSIKSIISTMKYVESMRRAPPIEKKPTYSNQAINHNMYIETDSERNARIEAQRTEAERQRQERERIAKEQKRIEAEQAEARRQRQEQERIAKEQKRIAEKQAAEYKIKTIAHDQNALTRVAQNIYNSEVLRIAAVQKLTDQNILTRVAQNIYNSETLRILAIQKLTDYDVLTRIVKNIYTPKAVYIEAKKRLTEIQKKY